MITLKNMAMVFVMAVWTVPLCAQNALQPPMGVSGSFKYSCTGAEHITLSLSFIVIRIIPLSHWYFNLINTNAIGTINPPFYLSATMMKLIF